MPTDPFAHDGTNQPPRSEPVRQALEIPRQELADKDLTFWDDKEVMESKTVGDTHYTRAYIRDTDREGVWATRDSGEVEQVASPYDEGISVSSVWSAVTGPEAPTELGEQMQYEEELQHEVPPWDDRQTELDRLLQEYPNQLDMAREDLQSGTLDQAGYDARVAELETFKQGLEDELKTYDMERGEVTAQEPVLDKYAQELAEDGITGDPLAEHDWQPGHERPRLGEDFKGFR